MKYSHPFNKEDKIIITNNFNHSNLMVGDTYIVEDVTSTLLGCILCGGVRKYHAVAISECKLYDINPLEDLPLFVGLAV